MYQRTIIAIMLLLLLSACTAANPSGKPVVDVITPADGAQFAVGESVSLRVAAASGSRITRVEVHTGGALVAMQNNPSPGPTYSAILVFVPNQAGAYKLTVTAVDGTGQVSDPVYLTVNIGGAGVANVTPTSAPAQAGTPAPQAGGTCKLGATFVSDVTIPDYTAVNAGTGFVKTWKLRNTSACNWEANYSFAFSDGEQMGAPASVPVPAVGVNAEIDVSVPFTAPASSGVYTSTWRMRAPDGAPFGNRVYVVIRVP